MFGLTRAHIPAPAGGQCRPRDTLQLLLALECAASLIIGANRSVFAISKLQRGSFDDSGPALTKFFSHMCTSINNYLCLAYTSERIIATVYVKTYEKHRPYYGSACVLSLVSARLTVKQFEIRPISRGPEVGMPPCHFPSFTTRRRALRVSARKTRRTARHRSENVAVFRF